MKLTIRFGNGPVRSLNRIINIIIAIILLISFIMITDYALDKEMEHNDQVVRNWLGNSTKASELYHP